MHIGAGLHVCNGTRQIPGIFKTGDMLSIVIKKISSIIQRVDHCSQVPQATPVTSHLCVPLNNHGRKPDRLLPSGEAGLHVALLLSRAIDLNNGPGDYQSQGH